MKRMIDNETAFWSETFHAEDGISCLPYHKIASNHYIGAYDPNNGQVVARTLPTSLSRRIRLLAEGSTMTIYTILLSGIQCLLRKYTDEQSIIVGIPTFPNRSDVDRPPNDLILTKSKITETSTFRTLLHECKRSVAEAVAHQNASFQEIVKHIPVRRDASGIPVIHTIVSCNALHSFAFSRTVSFDILFHFEFDQDAIHLKMLYNERHYEPSRLNLVFDHFIQLLSHVLAEQELEIHKASMVSESEKAKVVFEFNDTATDYARNKTIHRLFEEQAERTPDNIAVIYEGRQLTYGQLNEKANQLAGLLQEQGVKGGTLVGILVERSLDMIIGVMGIVKAGGAYVPFEPQFPKERISRIISDSNISYLITQAEAFEAFEPFKWTLPSLQHIVFMDVDEPVVPTETIDSAQVQALWDMVAERASDRAGAGGFVSSYTGEPFREEEVDQYVSHVVDLVTPFLTKQSRILEIGCGSGLLMFELARQVNQYVGMDPSSKTQQRNRMRIAEDRIDNITLIEGFAQDVKSLDSESFDVVLIASTVQFFPGYRYLEQVIEQCERLLTPNGVIVIADVPDASRREAFQLSLSAFAQEHRGNHRPSANRDSMLYCDESFFRYAGRTCRLDVIGVVDRAGLFGNELQYRIDVVMQKTREVTASESDSGVLLWTGWHVARFPRSQPNNPATADDLAYVIFTSGSTGMPKGVMVKHRPVINLIEWANKTFGVGEHDRILFITSLCFDLSVYDIFGILSAGASIHVASRQTIRNPLALAVLLIDEPITFWDSTPAALQQLMPAIEKHGGARLKQSKLRLAFMSGDWIPVALPDALRRAFPQVQAIGLGGATEATVWSNYYPIERVQEHWTSIPYGKPIQNARYYILDDNLEPCPIGVTGELYIGGECLASGYLNAPGLTNERFIRDPFGDGTMYRTGDLARWFPDGTIEFMGRADHQVKIRGFRIELGEIHALLIKHDAVQEAVVLDRQDDEGTKSICAYFVARTPVPVTELRSYLSKWLPSYMLPANFVPIPDIPLTANGKVDRKSLPAPNSDTLLDETYAEPRNEAERKLAEIWSDVLGVDKVGIYDDFMSLGGDSLKAIQIMHRLQSHGYAVEIEHLLGYTHIAELGKHVQEAMKQPEPRESIDDVIPVQPVFVDSLYCAEMEIAAVAGWLGRGYAFMFADSWNFAYDPSRSEQIGGCLSANARFDVRLLENYHGISFRERVLPSLTEAIEDIRSELEQGRPVIVALKANAVPWDGGFRNPSNVRLHAATIVGFSQEDRSFICTDSWYGKYAVLFPMEHFGQAYLHHATLTVTKEEPSLTEWQEIIRAHVPTRDKDRDPYRQMRVFASAVKTRLNLTEELRDSRTWHDSLLIKAIFDLSSGRKMFANLLRLLADKNDLAAMEPMIERLEEASYRWRSVNKIIVNELMDPSHGTDYSLILADKIEEIAQLEEATASRLLDYCDSYHFTDNVEAGAGSDIGNDPMQRYDYQCLSIEPLLNNQGFGELENSTADLTKMGAYFLTEGMPSEPVVTIEGVPFRWPDCREGEDDNISCKGQVILIPEGRYTEISLLGCGEWGNYIETGFIEFADGTSEPFRIRFTDWTHPPLFGETLAWTGAIAERNEIRTYVLDQPGAIYMQKHPIPHDKEAAAIRLPYSPGMHIFAITLKKA